MSCSVIVLLSIVLSTVSNWHILNFSLLKILPFIYLSIRVACIRLLDIFLSFHCILTLHITIKRNKPFTARIYVYLSSFCSGKAAYTMLKNMTENPEKWKGRKILFIHTGGLLGLYDKAEQMNSMMGKWRKMEIDETVPRLDGTGKMF